MIYFFCGAPKHGSHFQLFIITESLKQQGIPFEPVGEKIFDHNDNEAAKKLLHELDQSPDEVFIAKGHFLNKKLLLSYQNIRIFHIWRDMGDVLVSRYHYQMKRYGKTYQDFSDFYRRDGRTHMFYQLAYQNIWRSVCDPRVFHIDYAELRQHFQESVGNMLKFADLLGVDVADLEARVSLDNLRHQQNDDAGVLFRRGAVGDYEAIISDEIQEDMKRIMELTPTMLRVHAFLDDPRVILAPYYVFPGKRFLNGAVRMLAGSKSSDQSHKSKPIIWWK
ncbi:MAG: sulfotransferase domain-containing protein [Anaerolineae bacterium]|nr:sulfotransferase domain-containing protein [Anaerolineae bacterium]